MTKSQAPQIKVCISVLIVLLLNQTPSPAFSESEYKAPSPESLPVLPDTEIPTTEPESSILSPTYFSLPPSASIRDDLETKSEETLSGQENPIGEEIVPQELALPPYAGDESPFLSPSYADASVLDTKYEENPSEENPSLPTPSQETDDLFQENTSLPPSPAYMDASGDENLSESQENPPLISSPPYVDPVVETTDGGSFSQQINQPTLSTPFIAAPTPETKYEQDQNPENLPEVNDYSASEPKSAALAPESDTEPTQVMAPSMMSPDDANFNLAPRSHPKILPFNYRAEDEPVEPYEEEEDSWDGANRVVAGILVGVGIAGVGGFVYQKRKKKNERAQYECLAKKGGV